MLLMLGHLHYSIILICMSIGCHYHCTGSRKSLTYWIPLLYIKHGITVVVISLKLLRGRFVEMLQDNSISAVSITASNATNELFEVILLG